MPGHPGRRETLLGDVLGYVVRSPPVPTLVTFGTAAQREDYQHDFLQRLGWRVDGYGILNIHRIGIEAPALCVWEEVRRWGPGCEFWPNRIAAVHLDRHRPGTFELFLLGRAAPVPWLPGRSSGHGFAPLFHMDLLRRQDTPGPLDGDNARFLLYRGSGGYPIGLFSIYVRSSIARQGEPELSQCFFVVAFDFYGRPALSQRRLLRAAWERVHNRVTGNVLNRFKAHCEAVFAAQQAGA